VSWGAGLDNIMLKLLTLLVLKLRPLGSSALSQSLYRLGYRGHLQLHTPLIKEAHCHKDICGSRSKISSS
jgi:hypothetical protein